MKKLSFDQSVTLVRAYHQMVTEGFTLRDLNYGMARLRIDPMGERGDRRVYLGVNLHHAPFRGQNTEVYTVLPLPTCFVSGHVPVGDVIVNAEEEMAWLISTLSKNWGALTSIFNPDDDDDEVEDIEAPTED